MITDSLRENSQKDLQEVLESINGTKWVYLDIQLSAILRSFVNGDFLKRNQVLFVAELEEVTFETPTAPNPDHVIFIARSEPSEMKKVAMQVRSFVSSDRRVPEFHILFTPQRTVICEQVLEDEGVLDRLEIAEFALGFIPIETDLLSLEMGSIFKQVDTGEAFAPIEIDDHLALRLRLILVPFSPFSYPFLSRALYYVAFLSFSDICRQRQFPHTSDGKRRSEATVYFWHNSEREVQRLCFEEGDTKGSGAAER